MRQLKCSACGRLAGAQGLHIYVLAHPARRQCQTDAGNLDLQLLSRAGSWRATTARISDASALSAGHEVVPMQAHAGQW